MAAVTRKSPIENDRDENTALRIRDQDDIVVPSGEVSRVPVDQHDRTARDLDQQTTETSSRRFNLSVRVAATRQPRQAICYR
jgi:hypothetical protein